MTVKIGEMTSEFSNASIAFVAIGMEVTDNGSNADSRLLNLSANGNTKFSIVKNGRMNITANVDSNTNLIQVVNNNEELVRVTPNVAKIDTTTYVKSYAEAYKLLTGNNLVLDLREASVFGTNSTSISSISFVKPVTNEADVEVYSCSLVLFAGGTISSSVWSTANVVWTSGLSPSGLSTQPAILTFMSIGNSSTWYGIISGHNYS